MERKLERYLTSDEIVHHKDENKQNDEEWNLELTYQGGHNTSHFLGKKKTKVLSDETRRKLSDAAKKRWRKKDDF